MNTRREFFAVGAAAGVAATAPLAGVCATRAAGALPSQAAFEALIGQGLAVSGSGRFTLLAVRPLGQHDARLSQFVLLLSSHAVPALPASVQQLHHPRLGTFSLRLQASGRDERGHLYRAEIATLA